MGAKIEPSPSLEDGTLLRLIRQVNEKPASDQVLAYRRELARGPRTEEVKAYLEANLALALSDESKNAEAYVTAKSAWTWFKHESKNYRARMLNNLVMTAGADGYVEEANAWLSDFKTLGSQDPVVEFSIRLNHVNTAVNCQPARAFATLDELDQMVDRLPSTGKAFGEAKISREMGGLIVALLRAAALGNSSRLAEALSVLDKIDVMIPKVTDESDRAMPSMMAGMVRLTVLLHFDEKESLTTAKRLVQAAGAYRMMYFFMIAPWLASLESITKEDVVELYRASGIEPGKTAIGPIATTVLMVGAAGRANASGAEQALTALDAIRDITEADLAAEDREPMRNLIDAMRCPCLILTGRYAEASRLSTDKDVLALISSAPVDSGDDSMFGRLLSVAFSTGNLSARVDRSIADLASLESLSTRTVNELSVTAKKIKELGLGAAMLQEAEVSLQRATRERNLWDRQEAHQSVADAYLQLAKEHPDQAVSFMAKRRSQLVLAVSDAEELGDVDALADAALDLASQDGAGPDPLGLRQKAFDAIVRTQRLRLKSRLLLKLGDLCERSGDVALAERCFDIAEQTTRRGESSVIRAIALGRLGLSMLRDPKRSALGVALAKNAIDLIQAERSKLGVVSLRQQRELGRSLRAIYERLAESLIQMARYPEAQEVMAMLKEDEQFGFVRGSSIDPYERRLALLAREQGWWIEWEKLRDKAAQVLFETDQLLLKPQRTKGEDEKLAQLKRDATTVNLATSALVAAIGDEVEKLTSKATGDAERKLEGLRKTEELDQTLLRLDRDGKPTAAIYVLLTDRRLHEIVVGKDGRFVKSQEVDIVKVRHLIGRFLAAIRSPGVDPRTAGKELYDLLFAPIEGDLEQRGIKYLMWSLDGPFRYIPMAALWDGDRYLVERYPLAFFSPLRMDVITESAAPDWHAAAFGSSRGAKGLSALPSVKDELRAIVDAIQGREFLDDAFTSTAFQGVLEGRRESILHLATHFRLRGNVETSTLLLGDGTELSLEQMREWSLGDKRLFAHLELLYLSACSTAESVSESAGPQDGQEVDSFAALALKLGAKSVIATLWPVADASTAAAARAFYRAHTTTLGKAEALRSVQVAMITGALEALGNETPRSDPTTKPPVRSTEPAFAVDPKRRFAHPYYWAPFQLFGNWK